MMMAAPYAIAAALPRPALPAPQTEAASLAAWHSLLEERWQQRLSTLTELALAYHDAEETCGHPAAPAETARLQRLLRETTSARHALGETEDTLARLSDGTFGRCEQCARPIPTAELLAEPETRYCPDCVAISWVTLAR
jgi:RNA polymerase-binding transcription factor DksA